MTWRTAVQGVNKFEEYVLFLMVLQMGLSIFLQVIMRYVFHSAITWLDELVHIEVVMLTFFGASLGLKYSRHICVDALKVFLRQPYLSLLEALNNLVVVAYVTLVIIFGGRLIALMTAHPHYTPTLRIPKYYLYILVCFGLAFLGLRSLVQLWKIFSNLLSKRSSEDYR
jgi:TRAP-type C4-dicarboxylate transport system permease small subunit